METIEELIAEIKRNTAAQQEQNKKWRVELGLPEPEPTDLDRLLQKWKVELPSREPEEEELPLPEPRGEELPLPEPRGEAQQEQNKKWRGELGLPEPEPTELDRLLQKWKVELPSREPEEEEPPLPEPRGEELPLPEPRGEELPLPEPRGEEPPLPEPRGEEPPLPEPRGEEPPVPEPRGEELPLPEPRGEELPLPEPRGEAKSIPPPQPRPPPLRSSPVSLRPVPCPLLLDTLPAFLDLPVLDLEPRSLQHWPQLCPWFPAPLSPSSQTSLGCCQTSLLLPLFAASLPLGDRTSLHRFPGEDLCPLWHPPVPRPTLRSPLSARWGPSSPVRGPYLAGPGRGPTHPQVRPWKRTKKDICGLEVYDAVTLYNVTLTHVINTVAPLTTRTIKKDRNCPWYTLELRPTASICLPQA
ncbi:UNVERIFIED_CONTAM: hypothetical protein FKN15_073443 [Acipenser sinensis]